MGVKLFNSDTQPRVVAWGDGVVRPGEFIEVENPDSYGWPWVRDPEAEKALEKKRAKADSAPADEKPSEVTAVNDSPQED